MITEMKNDMRSFLMHYGIPGQKRGVRRFQTEDGELTPEGRLRYGVAERKFGSHLEAKPNQLAVKKRQARYGRGNIDLDNRKVVKNADGSISTERSFSVNIDGKETLLPTVINGKIVSEDEAIDHYYKTGEHLGRFDSVEEAEAYAEALHRRQEKKYGSQNNEKPKAEARILNVVYGKNADSQKKNKAKAKAQILKVIYGK